MSVIKCQKLGKRKYLGTMAFYNFISLQTTIIALSRNFQTKSNTPGSRKHLSPPSRHPQTCALSPRSCMRDGGLSLFWLLTRLDRVGVYFVCCLHCMLCADAVCLPLMANQGSSFDKFPTLIFQMLVIFKESYNSSALLL